MSTVSLWSGGPLRGTLTDPAAGVFVARRFALLLCLAPLLAAGWAHAQTQVHKPGQGAEGPQARTLAPPAAVPPPTLRGRVAGDRVFAQAELADAEVLDALGIRAVRALDEQLAGPDPACPRLRAGLRGATLARGEASLRVITAQSLLADDPPLLARTEALLHRLDSLGSEIDRRRRSLARRCPGDEVVVPRLWLPEEARAAVDGQVVVFASAGAAHRVVWVGDQPRAVTGADGWAVLVVPQGTVAVCVAGPEAERCTDAVEVYAAMGAAFEVTPRP